MLSGCASLHEVRPTSCNIESITPQGLRTIGMKIALGIENPSIQFSIVEAEAVLFEGGDRLATVNVNPFTVEKKSSRIYPVDAVFSINPGYNYLNLLNLVRDQSFIDKSTIDIYVKVRLKGGLSKKIERKGMPLKQFLQKIRL